MRALSGDLARDKNYQQFQAELKQARSAVDRLTSERETAYRDYLATTLNRVKLSREEADARRMRTQTAIDQSRALVKSLKAMRTAPSTRPAAADAAHVSAPFRTAKRLAAVDPTPALVAEAAAPPAPPMPAAVADATMAAAATPSPPAPATSAPVAPMPGTRPGFVAAPPPSVHIPGSQLGMRTSR